MEIRTLENIPISQLVETFNLAFSDYIIPVQWTEAIIVQKFKGNQVDLSLSPGFFIDGKLCGFIFHGIGKREGQPIVWNGGTGVVPLQRGQGITTQLYQFILPHLRNKGFIRTVLEVIDGNDPAIHTYQKNGFESIRKLECYSGEIKPVELPEGTLLKEINEIDWTALHACRSWQPTFQNDDHKLVALREDIQMIGAYDNNNKLLGYIAFFKAIDAGDVFQFAVEEKYRRKGIGNALFAKAAKGKAVPLKVINVDARHQASNTFLERIGFQRLTSQFEMIKNI